MRYALFIVVNMIKHYNRPCDIIRGTLEPSDGEGNRITLYTDEYLTHEELVDLLCEHYYGIYGIYPNQTIEVKAYHFEGELPECHWCYTEQAEYCTYISEL